MLLEGGVIIDGHGAREEDIKIEGSRIIARGENLYKEGDTVRRIHEKFLFPSLIDAHVHFRQPGYEGAEDWSHGARAALAGGVAAVMDMPNNNPITDSLERLDKKAEFARARGLDFFFSVAATEKNVEELDEFDDRAAAVKLFCSPTTGVDDIPSSPSFWRKVLSSRQAIAVHAEDGRLLKQGAPQSIEVVLSCLRELLPIALEQKSRLVICHVTSVEEVELINSFKEKGLDVSIEVTPHHLFLSSEDGLGGRGRVNPPLRSKERVKALRAALKSGLCDFVSSDHAPHPVAAKDSSSPSAGMPGVGTLLPVLLTLAAQQEISYEMIPQLTSIAPSRVYGLDRSPYLEPGEFADLVVVDPKQEWSLLAGDLRCGKSGWSPYEGRVFIGKPELTMRQGRVLYDDGDFYGLEKEGKWLNVKRDSL